MTKTRAWEFESSAAPHLGTWSNDKTQVFTLTSGRPSLHRHADADAFLAQARKVQHLKRPPVRLHPGASPIPLVTFAIHITWHDAPGVATPVLASTWAHVEFRIRDVPLFFRRDPADHVQRGAFVSAFPLAEWAATNFEDLLDEKPPRMHSFSARVSQRPAAQSWLRRHNLFTCREGMAYPDLSFVPLGDHVAVHWYRGGGYLTRGRVVLSRLAVERTLAQLVDDVCNQTRHVHDRAQDLRELWAATSNTLLPSVLVGLRDR